MPEILIYTDGACSGNPGPGGYGAILKYGEHEKEIKGGFRATTNNRMEILAVIEGLKALKKSSEVKVFSDSKYVINAMTKGWALNWKRKNWMRTSKEKAKNSDLWEQMLELDQSHKIKWQWVKGHAGDPMNERADTLAVEARDETTSHQVDEVFESGL